MGHNQDQGWAGRVAGKTAFVTGGARGIGRAIALRLADEARYVTGHTLVVDAGFLVKTD